MSSTAKVQAIPTLVDVAQVFPKRRLLVVGNLVADHYIYGQTDRVSREAPVLIVRYESSEDRCWSSGLWAPTRWGRSFDVNSRAPGSSSSPSARKSFRPRRRRGSS